MSIKYLIGNWKSNQNLTSSLQWLDSYHQSHQNHRDLKTIIALPFTAISAFNHKISELGTHLLTASQNVSHLPPGKHTGEIPASMLSELVGYCLVGHSERRHEFAETSEEIALKTRSLLDASITPIICLDTPYLEEQIKQLFHQNVDTGACIYVYEPVSAIGTGQAQDPESVKRVVQQIKFFLAGTAPILYGGSVTAENAVSYIEKAAVDGVLVGTDSLSPDSFVALHTAIYHTL
jgi:triosephosphate isomerase (TIM)